MNKVYRGHCAGCDSQIRGSALNIIDHFRICLKVDIMKNIAGANLTETQLERVLEEAIALRIRHQSRLN